jgi:L-2-hydroxyglutarate oxidase
VALNYDIVTVGAGVVGMSVAMQLSKKYPKLKICVIEKEDVVAKHQTGRNSGVIHSGIYYKPGSLKARTCTEGVKLLHDFCDKNDVPYETTGKLIVATSEKELPLLENLKKRGEENGLVGLKTLTQEQVQKREPKVKAIKGLFVPITGIIDYTKVVEAYASNFRIDGGVIYFNSKLKKVKNNADGTLNIRAGKHEFNTRYLINCAGLHSDRVAKACGVDPKLIIIPFRGDYFHLDPKIRNYVNGLIYPVPNPEFPFLGVHFTKMISGERECGPSAVLSLKREGYSKISFSLYDTLSTVLYPGFWLMALKFWRMGFGEMYRAFVKKAFLKEVKKLIPEIKSEELTPGEPGVRAQALTSDGKLADDFKVIETKNMVHVLNAPSPAATASLSIGRQIIEMAERNFELS